MGKKIAILQSNYIPWKGYFDIINMADEFIFYDDVQYTKNDWRNRNKLKCNNGVQWLTIPVKHNSLNQKISETRIAYKHWGKKHWETIAQLYSKAPYFNHYKSIFERYYIDNSKEYLSEINIELIKIIMEIIGIKTTLKKCSDYKMEGSKNMKLINIILQAEGTHYISGKAAQSYIDEKLFEAAGIKLIWMDYNGYPKYNQLSNPFEHCVSILDLIFCEGANAKKFMKSE